MSTINMLGKDFQKLAKGTQPSSAGEFPKEVFALLRLLL